MDGKYHFDTEINEAKTNQIATNKLWYQDTDPYSKGSALPTLSWKRLGKRELTAQFIERHILIGFILLLAK
jgi:hypothetical protein